MQNPAPRIALSQATALAVDSIAAAFERHWRERDQFSMVAALPLVQEQLACPALSSRDCAVLALQRAMNNV